MIPVDELDRLRLRSSLEHLSAAKLQILDQDDAVAIGEHIAMGILDDATRLRSLRLGLLGPFESAGDTLPLVGVSDHLIHGAFGAGWVGHVEKG